MKKFISIFVILLSGFLLTACDKEIKEKETDIYSFKYNDMNILLGEEFSRDKYGKELEYYETASCAFEDMDRIYTYEHYEISTYTLRGKENVLSVYFLDDNIATNEGVSIGDTYAKMISTYGKKFKEQGNLYIYTKDKTLLEFIVENDIITSIEYSYDTEK